MRAGYTILELIVATLITLVVVATATRAIVTLQDSVMEATLQAATLENARRLLDRIVLELRDAERESVVLSQPTDARSITFSTIEGWDGSGPVVSPSRTLSFDLGTVALDGTPIGALVKDLVFNLENSLLTIVVEIKTTTHVFGNPAVISRQLCAQLSL